MQSSQPLTVLSVAPLSGALVGIDAVPILTFSENIPLGNTTNQAISLASSIGNVNIAIASNGAAVTVTPTAPLVWGSHYQLSATSKLTSVAGHTLSAPYATSFDTRKAAWGNAAVIESTDSGSVQVISTGNGNALAVWQEFSSGDGVFKSVAAVFNAKTATWSSPKSLQTSANSSGQPMLGADDTGNATAIWPEFNSGASFINTAIFNPQSMQWSAPIPVPTQKGLSLAGPKMAMDHLGNIALIWQQYSIEGIPMTAGAYYTASKKNWSTPGILQTGTLSGLSQNVAIDANGNAIAIWAQANDIDPTTRNIYAAIYSVTGQQWEAPTLIQSGTADASNPALAFDTQGNAIVVWSQTQTNGNRLITEARYNGSSKSWSTPQLIQQSGLTGDAPGIVIDAGGNATVVWSQGNGAEAFVLASARYLVATGAWKQYASLESINSSLTLPYDMPFALASDPAGNVIVAWNSNSGNSVFHAHAARFSAADDGWGPAVLLQSNTSSTTSPTLAVDETGQAIVLWAQDDIDSAGQFFRIAFNRYLGL